MGKYFYNLFSGEQRPHNGDVMISFLPLAHMLERCCEHGIYYTGAAVGFSSGNMQDFSNDLKTLKPTIMPAVPRLLNRVYEKFQKKISNSFFRRVIYNLAFKSKKSDLYSQILRKNTIWDKLVFQKIQKCKYYEFFSFFQISKLYNTQFNTFF